MSVSRLITLHGSTVTVVRPVCQRSSTGGWNQTSEETWQASAWIQALSSSDRMLYSARSLEVTHAMYVAEATAVRAGDSVTSGETSYLVVGAAENQAGMGQVWKIMLRLKE